MDRSIGKIDESLRQVLRGLIAGERPWPLLIHGAAGRGKTCAALCLLDYAGGDYWTAADLCETLLLSRDGKYSLRGDQGPVAIYPRQFWGILKARPLVVIDEIGLRENATDYQYETLQRALDARHTKPAVYISNLKPDALRMVYDDRIASRMTCGTVVEVVGDDRRAIKESP